MTSTATLRYQKQWRLERGRGLYRTVTADTVREHLRDLLRGEASLRGIAEVSGVPTSVVARISSGQQPTVTRRVSSALMKITPHDLTARPNAAGFVPKVGAVRRIRAHSKRSGTARATSPMRPHSPSGRSTWSSTKPDGGSPRPDGKRSPKPTIVSP